MIQAQAPQWLKEKYQIDLLKPNEMEMSCFLILWPYFEKTVLCKHVQSASLGIIREAASINADRVEIIQKVKEWYIDNKAKDHLFHLFNFKSRQLKEKVQAYLDQRDVSSECETIFVLAIMYQFRCNLFHGEKELGSIAKKYVDKFRCFNQSLMTCLA